MGAWIETSIRLRCCAGVMSHPTWVRGLKHTNRQGLKKPVLVAPYVGAWIETQMSLTRRSVRLVAPYVGAWIETQMSLTRRSVRLVAPYVGAWIET